LGGQRLPGGHTFWITVTDSLDNVKATATVASEYGGGWGGDGFQTEEGDWSTQPDIQVDDRVYVEADDATATRSP